MRLLKDNDFKTFEQLCALSQKAMKRTMSTYLRKKYNRVIETPDYICAEGDIPIALVAHMDTVFPRPAEEVFYDRVKNVIWSPDGLGADDRAGIYAIYEIIRSGLRPHIIFTTDEEKGAAGALALAGIECPFKDLRYVIELDRRGSCDCVFYDCDNKEFIEYVENFGFVEALGSFSDISMFCPTWKIAGVNLSVGYRDEHSVSEVLFVGHLLSTIDKVKIMLKAENIPSFEYIPSQRASVWYHSIATADNTHCCICGKEYNHDEMIPVNRLDGTVQNYCIDCISGRVDWCQSCGEAYEIAEGDTNKSKLCEDCLSDFYDNYRY